MDPTTTNNLKLLNAGCGTHYAEGWVNCDVWQSGTTQPDVLVERNNPYPFSDNYFDAAYLGHVLEHIEWEKVSDFVKDIQRMLKPGAPLLVVGPDVFKTIKRWKENKEPWSMVLSTIEHQDFNYQPDRETEQWDGCAHFWNCHHERVWNLLTDLGFSNIKDYYDLVPNDTNSKWWTDPSTNITWPVVGKWYWQFAIHCQA